VRVYPTVEAFIHDHPLFKQNSHGGRCTACGAYVAPNKGLVVRRVRNGRRTWHIRHLPVIGPRGCDNTTTAVD
jgi:hypothetical protein